MFGRVVQERGLKNVENVLSSIFSSVSGIQVGYDKLWICPTGRFTILEPENMSIEKPWLAEKRRYLNFEALKLANVR